MKETKLGRILLRIKYIITYQFLMNSAHGIQINKAIDKFHAGGATNRERKKLILKILEIESIYKLSAEEYFLYHIDKCDKNEIKSFVSDNEKNIYCFRLNPKKNKIIFDDKVLTYKYFEKYYKRKVVKINIDDSCEKLDVFDGIDKIIVKPINGGRGAGIKIFSLSKDNKNDILMYIQTECTDGAIVEEFICQTEKMASLHPESVNTVRMPTIRYDDYVDVIHPFLRMGQGNSQIDNASAGGIMGFINVKDGKVFVACDEAGHYFDKHPTTGVELKGFEIPRWNEAIKLVTELAEIIPDNRYISWDLALTDDGWVIVEGNAHGQFLWQIPYGEGFREELDQILDRLGLSDSTR